ncbi:coiled-coil domain-containing protein 25 [Colletotrichum liriopes]|uniref:Coiled-coil domain-containing protein 25 n=1 Tax=Colletotrichum liriopes TaxID=708192 RepID=A0AA37GSI6_9PEZI|nr:coiled-coil domain-containing protein 25 [Colletotrichum liriopes]
MVYYFTSKAVDPAAFIYVGKDKFEIPRRQALLGTHLPPPARPQGPLHDVPMTWDAIPEPLLVDLAQLTKANSIEGNKKDNVTVIYTPWSNLKKDGSMEVGQKREEARIAQERKEKKWQKDHAYDDIFTEENMESTSNQNRDADWEDDFM